MIDEHESIFRDLGQGIEEERQRFRMLDPISQNLERASHGFALAVLLVVAPLFLFGKDAVLGFAAAALRDPARHGVAIAAWGSAMGYALARGLAGASRIRGLRDGLRKTAASGGFLFWSVVAAFLFLMVFPSPLGGWVFLLLDLVLWTAAYKALSFAAQIYFLSRDPVESGREQVAEDIEREKFSWKRLFK
jgi:hypothetical protein